MPSQLIIPIQSEVLDIKLKLNTHETYLEIIKAGVKDLQDSRSMKMGRAEFFRLATACAAGAGAVWALVQRLKP